MRYIISQTLASLTLTLGPACAAVPVVITDIPPVHALVAQVMGDLGQAELLLPPGASEHDFQLRPSQASALESADLLIWVGPELTPWLDHAAQSLRPKGAQLALLDASETIARAYAPDGAHDPEHEAKEAGHDDHDHSGTDPHAWLDPDNAKIWAGLIAEALATQDPEHAATYRANAAATQARIAAMDSALLALLEPVRGKPAVVFHDAYGYFAAHYGLTLSGSVALGDATKPGAAHMVGLHDLAASNGAGLCLFPDAQYDAGLIEQLADGTGARIGGALDPNGSTLAAGPDAYDMLMKSLAKTLVDCLKRV